MMFTFSKNCKIIYNFQKKKNLTKGATALTISKKDRKTLESFES